MDRLAQLLQASPRPAAAGLRWARDNPAEAAALSRREHAPPAGLSFGAVAAWRFLEEHCGAHESAQHGATLQPQPAASADAGSLAHGEQLWRPLRAKRTAGHQAKAPARQNPSKRPRAEPAPAPVDPRVLRCIEVVRLGGSEDAEADVNLVALVDALPTESEATATLSELRRGSIASDRVLTRALRDFSAACDRLTHSTCACFFDGVVRPWVESLDAKPARAAVTAVVDAAKLRLALAVERAVLPVVALPSLNAFQRSVLSKILVTGFPKSQRSDVVARVCRAGAEGGSGSGQRWSDEHAALLGELVQGGAALTPGTLEELARGLALSIAARPKSKPLGKLAMTVLQRPRGELRAIIDDLERACNACNTVISKSLQAALKRLRQQPS